MTDNPETPPTDPATIADSIIIQVAGIVIQGVKDTDDPRLKSLSDTILNLVKEGDMIQTVLVALSNLTKPVPKEAVSPHEAILLQQVAKLQARKT